jgi:hypothetical protein
MEVVRKFGFRTGVEIRTVNDALEGYDAILDAAEQAGVDPPPPDLAQEAAQAQLTAFADALSLDMASARFILDQIAEDPYTEFQYLVWAPEPQ